MARFFIDRPVFAMVISLFLVLAGVLSLFTLPVAQYPDIAPPTVRITGVYPGASSDVIEQAVTSQIDSQVNGVTDMRYIKGVSSSDGTSVINVTFALECDVDLAAVETQNRVAQVAAKLPTEVNDIGVSVSKTSPDTLMYVAFYSPDERYEKEFVYNYMINNVVDQVKRVTGVGDVSIFGSEFSMRVWLRPDRLAGLGLTPIDVVAAIQEQNKQAAAGAVGRPPIADGTSFEYSLRVQGRLQTVEQFENIILRSDDSGSTVRLRDVARVEFGLKDYTTAARFNGKDAAVIGIALAPGANATATAAELKTQLTQMETDFPEGYDYNVVYDSSDFVNASIEEVIHTFFEALVLVLIVVFLFLQSWRATLIPMLAVPVSLISTMIVFGFLGFSINTLSLFGMVLAIGIVVDDAIVVVEAVELKMEEEGLSPLAATRAAMEEVSGPIIAMTLILCAVFIPMAFVPGVTGQLYKQFALTIAVSTLFSALIALTLTPALCALMLKPKDHGAEPKNILERFFAAFNRGFDWLTEKYLYLVGITTSGLKRVMLVMALILIAIIFMGRITPTGFVPDEDTGAFFVQASLPDASSTARTGNVVEGLSGEVRKLDGVRDVLSITGFDVLSGTKASNSGLLIVRLYPWEERSADEEQIEALLANANRIAMAVPEAIAFAFNPPALPGFGASSGFSMILQARGESSAQELAAMTQQYIQAAQARPEIGRISSTYSASTPSYDIEVDREKAKKLGIAISSIFTTLQVNLGSVQVNDFARYGKNYQVIVQADGQYRKDIEGLSGLYVRSGSGEMVPLNTLVKVKESYGPRFTTRFNLYRSAEISGTPAPGYSSGEALAALEQVAGEVLTSEYGYVWSGQTLEEVETGNSASIVMALSVVIVFLFLAALYESWSIPIAVLTAAPFGFLGAFLLLLMRGMDFNVYGQVGVVTLVGLAAKNAILIVEFAVLYREEKGMATVDAAIAAAKLRLRPILMTSFAFILGVVPLVTASGAGAASKNSVGTVVFGGMLAATLLAVLLVPALYVIVQKATDKMTGNTHDRDAADKAAGKDSDPAPKGPDDPIGAGPALQGGAA